MKKPIIAIFILVIITVAGWRIYSGLKTSSPGHGGPGAVAVEVTPIKKSAIFDEITLTGSLTPRREYLAAAQVPGRVVQMPVDLGDRIERGQLVAVLDDEEYGLQAREAEAQLQVARAGLRQKQSDLETARREFERARTLHKKNIISDSDFDLAKSALASGEAGYNVAKAQLKEKEAALESAGVSLSHTRILASWEEGEGARTIGLRFVDEGALVRANDPIVSILDINSLIAVVHVVESDYFRISAGQEAEFSTDALPGRTFTGQISRIAPLLEQSSREAVVEIEVPNEDWQLRPGMYVRAKIVVAGHEQATVAPVMSLVRRDGKQGLFIVNADGATVRFTPVKVGIVNGAWAEIVEPAVAGMVVTLGQHLLHDGARVIIPESASTGFSPGSSVRPGDDPGAGG